LTTRTERTSDVVPAPGPDSSQLPVVDCDVHQEMLNGPRALLPYLAREWRHYITAGGFPGMPSMPYAAWQGPDRLDTSDDNGVRAGAYFDRMKEMHLDRWNIRNAILTGPANFSVCYLAQYEFAAALARAFNDWTLDNWISQDTRLKGSMAVAAQLPEEAAAEIRRIGDHPDIVQVILPTRSPSGIAWADEKYFPIWEAAQEKDLAIGFHISPSGGNVLPPTSAGWPRSYMELNVNYPWPAPVELAGFVCRGVFERYPGLRIAYIENAFAWVPALMWRLDQAWRSLRAEVPWLKQRPSDYVRQRVRFTTQPMEEPDTPEEFRQLIKTLDEGRMLMFSSDYPHWNFDSPTRAFPVSIDDAPRRAIMSEQATAFYRL
jgi:uncharacterized protein